MNASKVLGKALQFCIADSQHVEFFHGRKHVISARSGTAMALARVMQLVGQTEPSRILAMAPIDDVTKRVHALLRIVVKPNSAPRLAIDESDLLARAEIFNRLQSLFFGNSVCDAATIATAI